jgi:hypothetical protein
MVRSVILVSAIALYLSLSAVEAQAKQDVSNESLQTLITYLKDHPASQGKQQGLPTTWFSILKSYFFPII